MSTRVILRSDHEGLYQERPLYCPIYECRSFIPQARIDSHGVGTCIRCTSKSCCFCGKLGVHASHLNCPVVIRILERSSRHQDFANLSRSMSGRSRWRQLGSSVYRDEHTGDASLFSLAIGLVGDAGAMINSMEGHSDRVVGRISLSANFSVSICLSSTPPTPCQPIIKLMADNTLYAQPRQHLKTSAVSKPPTHTAASPATRIESTPPELLAPYQDPRSPLEPHPIPLPAQSLALTFVSRLRAPPQPDLSPPPIPIPLLPMSTNYPTGARDLESRRLFGARCRTKIKLRFNEIGTASPC